MRFVPSPCRVCRQPHFGLPAYGAEDILLAMHNALLSQGYARDDSPGDALLGSEDNILSPHSGTSSSVVLEDKKRLNSNYTKR